jgi:Gpi18-like mannosyltransferase
MQKPSQKFAFPFLLWLFFRIMNSIAAVVFSNFSPVSQIEKDFKVWPPSANISLWFYRVFLAPWLRWDAKHFVLLLRQGYVVGNGSTSFHPLYIILSKPLYLLGIDPLFSLLIVSSLAALIFFWIFFKLAGLDLSWEKSVLALVLLSTFPLSVILFAPYTESVFLVFATLALYEMRKRNWLLAALAIFLAALARQQGVFLIFPVLWYLWEDSGKSFKGLARTRQGWLAVCAAPSGLVIWAIYRIAYLHEGGLNYQNWQGFIYSVLLSPSAKIIYPAQSFLWPWNVLLISTPRLFHAPDIQDLMTYAIGIGFLILFALAWKSMNIADRIYCAVIFFISFSISSGPVRIYLSLPRHLLLATPVFIGLAARLNKRWQQITLVSLQFAVQGFMLFLYVCQYWIP